MPQWWTMPKKNEITSDWVLKEIFQGDHPILLNQMTRGAEVTEFLNVEFHRTIARRADLVARLGNGRLLHVEFQSRNDNDFVYREGIYCLLIGRQYRLPVEQVVLYVGQAKMSMKSRLNAGSTKVSIRLIDIREFDVDMFLRSGRPGDLALAALASDGVERLLEIAQAVVKLNGAERDRVLLQLVVLLGLRKLPGELKMEFTKMTHTYIDLKKNELIRAWFEHEESLEKAKAEAKGRAEGEVAGMLRVLRQQLNTKFGKLPKWADDRIEGSRTSQIDRWSKKLLTADTVEGVLGRK